MSNKKGSNFLPEIDTGKDSSGGINLGAIEWLEDGARDTLSDAVNRLREVHGIDSKIELPTGYLSVSQVNTYLRCPKQFEFRYILGIRQPPRGVAIQGSGIHATFEVGYNEKRRISKDIPLEQALDTYNDYMNNNLDNDTIMDEDVPEKAFRAIGENIIRRWHKDKLPYVRPKAVEKPFATILNGIPTVGIIDLLDDTPTRGLIVADTKTAGKRKSQADADNSLQFTLYAAVTNSPEQRMDVFVRPAVRKSGAMSEPSIQELYTVRTKNDVLWLQEVFTSVAKSITSGSFPPTTPDSWVCSKKWCGFWEHCRGKYEKKT